MLNLNIYDTYYVFEFKDLTYLISFIFLLTGFGYYFMLKAKRDLSTTLNFVHIFITFVGLLIISVLPLFYREGVMQYQFNQNIGAVNYVCILLVVLGQIIFPINIIRGLIKPTKVPEEKK